MLLERSFLDFFKSVKKIQKLHQKRYKRDFIENDYRVFHRNVDTNVDT